MTPHQQKYIEELYLDKYEPLFSYARTCLPNDALAEEAVQETFRIVCMKSEEACNCLNINGWLITILKNVIRNIRRQHRDAEQIFTEYIEAQMGHILTTTEEINVDITYSNIADSKEFRLIKELVLEGRSVWELAEARDITVDACQKRIQRAKKFLRKRIQ